ncbi:lipase family protein [Nocardia sp. BMG111209]|uniref:lipase family protein n=1 Tax=Nocardia sp. BMG111209 TaxID=1160137 RepID=UPI0009DB7A84
MRSSIPHNPLAGVPATGITVSVPGHEGPDGRIGTAREPGYRVLEGIRAAQPFRPLALSTASRLGLWGCSGGGLVTSWAARRAAVRRPGGARPSHSPVGGGWAHPIDGMSGPHGR